MPITAKQLAENLWSLLTTEFGGKPEGGRYIIDRDRLAQLAGRQTLRQPFLDELFDEGLAIDIVIVNLDTFFSVQELGVIKRHRNVPPSVIQRLVKK